MESRFAEIIGASLSLQKVVEMTRIVAPTEATVLITGESGTGKELFARAIHANSARKSGSLVTVNCAALTETLLNRNCSVMKKAPSPGPTGNATASPSLHSSL